MSAPTPAVRATMYDRDHNQCALCGRHDQLSHQHRRAVGMGGSKTPPSITDSVTLCLDCNGRCESDLQTKALVYGVKVRRWVKDPAMVPVLFPFIWGWARLTPGGHAEPIHAVEAARMMRKIYGDEWDQWRAEISLPIFEGSGVDV